MTDDKSNQDFSHKEMYKNLSPYAEIGVLCTTKLMNLLNSFHCWELEGRWNLWIVFNG